MKHRRTSRSRAVPAAPRQPVMPWRFMLLTFFFASVVAVGFFFAARQHFSSMDLGIKNSKLRKQLEDLEAERRRLVLAREVTLSPGEVLRTARSLGFAERQAESMLPVTVSQAKPVETMPKATLVANSEATKPVQADTKPAIVKTVDRSVETKRTQKPPVQVAAVAEQPSERPRRVAHERESRVVPTAATLSRF